MLRRPGPTVCELTTELKNALRLVDMDVFELPLRSKVLDEVGLVERPEVRVVVE